MDKFRYYAPTKVVFGRDTQKEVGRLVKEFGGTKVLVHYGGGSAVRSGLIAQVERSLDEAGIAYVELGGVQPNPLLSLCLKGMELCRKENVDFLLAVGGGSVIDSAKCIGYGLANEGDVWDIFAKKRPATGCMPIGTVLTIAAAGSEMSNSCVITNDDGMIKRGYSSDYARCAFAVMNPELTFTLPAYQTASGCVDIIMHTFERYFTKDTGTMLMDGIAEALIRTVMYNAKVLVKDPENYEARAQIMWAGTVAHNGIMSNGQKEDWGSHQVEHELSAMFGVTHGAGLAAVWGSWARYVYTEKPERFAQFAVNVMGVPMNASDINRTALDGIEAMEQFFREIHMPVSLPELGLQLSDEQIRELSEKCCNYGGRTIGAFRVMNADDVEKIYHMAMGETAE